MRSNQYVLYSELIVYTYIYDSKYLNDVSREVEEEHRYRHHDYDVSPEVEEAHRRRHHDYDVSREVQEAHRCRHQPHLLKNHWKFLLGALRGHLLENRQIEALVESLLLENRESQVIVESGRCLLENREIEALLLSQ